MVHKPRNSGLGRGLSALLEEVGGSSAEAASGREPATLPLAAIGANPGQPRRHFDPQAMAELVASVHQRGVLQPILVRPRGDGRYEVVAGERRWRAAQAAQLHEIPVVIRTLSDTEAHEVALIENIQRVDLNAIEEAEGYARLIRDFGHTQEDLAALVGKARSHVANLLRLLDLPEAIRAMVIDRRISMGHARVLVSAAEPMSLAHRIIADGLSVRATEALASRTPRDPMGVAPGPRTGGIADANVTALERDLSWAVGSAVTLRPTTAASGSITLRYASLEQLDLICTRLIPAR